MVNRKHTPNQQQECALMALFTIDNNKNSFRVSVKGNPNEWDNNCTACDPKIANKPGESREFIKSKEELKKTRFYRHGTWNIMLCSLLHPIIFAADEHKQEAEFCGKIKRKITVKFRIQSLFFISFPLLLSIEPFYVVWKHFFSRWFYLHFDLSNGFIQCIEFSFYGKIDSLSKCQGCFFFHLKKAESISTEIQVVGCVWMNG